MLGFFYDNLLINQTKPKNICIMHLFYICNHLSTNKKKSHKAPGYFKRFCFEDLFKKVFIMNVNYIIVCSPPLEDPDPSLCKEQTSFTMWQTNKSISWIKTIKFKRYAKQLTGHSAKHQAVVAVSQWLPVRSLRHRGVESRFRSQVCLTRPLSRPTALQLAGGQGYMLHAENVIQIKS